MTESVPGDDAFIFNVVWNGTSFTYLQYFVASQLAHSGARYRFVCNACPREQIALIDEFATRFPSRVVEVFDASPRRMVGHGDALDAVLASRDDGEFFSFIDPDILATGPFLSDFAAVLADGADIVTSGRGVWSETDVVPDGHPGVNGEYFYGPDGYVFGSPHFAIYRRDPLVQTLTRFSIGLGSGGPELPDAVRAELQRCGQDYWVFDTAKVANILMQEAGHRLVHMEHDNLMHIGGMSHYLSPPGHSKWVVLEEGAEPEPEWVTWNGMESRFEVARFSAAVLRNLCEKRPAPEIPDGVEPRLVPRLATVRDALVHLVATYEEQTVG